VATLAVRNVCEALPTGVDYLLRHGAREESRAGPVLVAPGPVVTVTRRPTERVLFSAVRDANPFFHLAEAIWMLAGRDDATFLNRYVTDFGERFAESASGKENTEAGGRIHGAYGARWRGAFGFDQLNAVVDILRKDPSSRQCVLAMWDATKNSGSVDRWGSRGGQNDLRGKWRDRPCNTHAYLRIRKGNIQYGVPAGDHVTRDVITQERWLDLTVCCRSNDAVWGAHGANAVHFSVLQEYLAARIGVGVGVMYQVSNNYHVYEAELARLTDRTSKAENLKDAFEAEIAAHSVERDKVLPTLLRDNRYENGWVRPQPMFVAPEDIDQDVQTLCRRVEQNETEGSHGYNNPWFWETAERAFGAHHAFKQKDFTGAKYLAGKIDDLAWATACWEWIERRRK
jgi:thymidylate synthase